MKDFSRRRFLSTAALGVAGISILPSLHSCKNVTNSDEIRLGLIGMGRQAQHLMNGFIKIPGVKFIAGCDVHAKKRKRFEIKVKNYSKKVGVKADVKTYEKYQDLLNRQDIDAVVIALPDHSHAMVAIAACKAGKDVYLEKPMTFTIKEGQVLRKVVRETNRVLAVGSQQRSMFEFQHAVKLVQTGALGHVDRVQAFVGAPPKPFDLPEQPIPADLNWDLWLSNLSTNIPYNEALCPEISIDPIKNETKWGGWRWYKETGGGYTTDWGAHMFDIAQWALEMDGNGPVEITPLSSEYLQFKYANGVVMTSEPFNGKRKGVKFFGSKGWIEVSRGYFKASNEAWDLPQQPGQEVERPHLVNFIESIKTRKDPMVPVEIGHSSGTVCNLGNIAFDLNRTLKWNPDTEEFIDDFDGQATAKLHHKYREGWSLV